MNDSISLALSTHISPAEKFTIDGEEFELLGTEHLSSDDEAEAMALFSRHTLLANELDATANVQKGKIVAERLRSARLQILAKLTTAPTDVLGNLPLSAQVKLLEAIQAQIETDEFEDGETAKQD